MVLAVRRSRFVAKKRVPSAVRSVVKNPLASSGTIVYRGSSFTERVDWAIGQQGFSQLIVPLMSSTDIQNSFVTAVGNTTAATDATAPVIEPNFWIKRASMKISVTNCSQVDALVTFWPCVARYDYSGGDSAHGLFVGGHLESKAYASASTAGDPTEIGYTPFQNRALCESYRFLKPVRKFLQGGQSVTVTLTDPKPFHFTYGHIGWASSANFPGVAIKDHTRECLITATAAAMVTNTSADVSPGFGSILVSFVRTYEWVAAPMPHHYDDLVGNYADVDTPAIIQPQTGAVNTTPVSVPS